MGMICGGEVADASYYAKVEKPFLLLPSTYETYCIRFYCRFKDDCLMIIGGDMASRSQLFSEIRSRSTYYQVNMDSLSSNSINFLDVTLFKGPRWSHTRRLDYSMYTKPNNQWAPLLRTSCHPVFVHDEWPKSRVGTIRKRFSCKSAAQKRVEHFSNLLFKLTGTSVDANHHHQASANTQKAVFSRLILPWRPQWVKARLGKVVRGFSCWKNSILQMSTDLDITNVGISWSLGGVHLIQRLHRHNDA